MTTVGAGVVPASNVATTMTAKDTQGLNQNFDQFLMLLTTQLKNQDPLSPMDATQFTNQLVSFSGVEQQIKINDNLTKMLALTQATQTTLGLSYIGLNVDVHGDTFQHFGGPEKMSYTLPDVASLSTIHVLDQNGNTVYSQAGETTKGTHKFDWDGTNQSGQPVPMGTYKLLVGALDPLQKPMGVSTVVPGRVEGIQTADDGSIMLIIDGKEVPMSSVTKATL